MSLAAMICCERPGWDLDVAFEVEAGEVVALLGPNGAGKTTTLAAVAGLEPVRRGGVVLGGRVLLDTDAGVWVPAAGRRIGIVFQEGRLFPHLSARDNVAFGPECRGLPRSQARAVAQRWLERVGVADRASARPADLSGGEAQRVAIARALATEPAALLLDEPLASVDASARSGIRRVLADAASPERPLLLVTQDLVDAAVLADRVVVLEDGRVTQTGTIDEVTRRPRSQWAARLVGVNLFRGVSDGVTVMADGDQRIVAADAPAGDVFVAIHPNAVALYRDRPEGTPRNVWPGRVGDLESLGGRVRVTLDGPLALVAEVTPSAVQALGLGVGREVWAAVKATEVVTYGL